MLPVVDGVNILRKEESSMLPVAVGTTMSRLCKALHDRLPGTIESVYVYGSVALDAYIEGSSDIDFLVFVNKRLEQADIRAIAAAHEEVERAIPNADIMGAYIRREDAGQPACAIPSYPTYYERKLHTDGTGADLNPVTWRILRESGICVYGSDMPFTFAAPEQELADYVIGNMNTYWHGWIQMLSERSLIQTLPERPLLSAVLLDEAVEWCVLGMLRQLYTIRERGVTSKIGAGEYGLLKLPDRWHALIREAIAIKRREPEREYDSQPERLQDLTELLRFIQAVTNRLYREAQ